jgi:hypothetical protein
MPKRKHGIGADRKLLLIASMPSSLYAQASSQPVVPMDAAKICGWCHPHGFGGVEVIRNSIDGSKC